MVPGTHPGELFVHAGLPRNATVAAERPAVLWCLGADTLRQLERNQPEMARHSMVLVLKGALFHDDMRLRGRKSRFRYFRSAVTTTGMIEDENRTTNMREKNKKAK